MRTLLHPRRHGTRKVFDRFQLTSVLGEGGFGTVYRAYDQVLGSDVALKVLDRMSLASITRFRREFRLAGELVHPNLVRLGELFERDGQWAFSMELLEGVHFSRWVRPGGVTDEARLRDALCQLSAGLQALHRAHLVHRDIKPQNVLVTPEGRAVLLDFGLVASLDAPEQSSALHAPGTVAYMAPEQADGSAPTPAADLYALGVLLYEALTGRLPFRGELMQVLLAKYGQTPVPPSLIDASIPADLDLLAIDLLKIAAAERPSLPELVMRLSGRATPAAPAPAPAEPRRVFVGRAAELAELQSHFDQCRSDGPTLVLVRGEGGIGKTALIEEFVERVKRDVPDVQVLHGRCHALEQVTYKAFDEIAAQLAKLCRKRSSDLPPLPASSRLLPRLFSVFAFLSAAPDDGVRVERHELFAAFVELLTLLASERPLLLAIDDLQWSDRDSTVLLQYVLEHCSARGVLLIGSARADESDALSTLSTLDSPRTHQLVVRRLEAEEAWQLAVELSGSESRGELERLRVESGGHPLFLQELARGQRRSEDAPLTLEAAFLGRAALLDADTRAVLDLVCVVGGPVPQSVLVEAVGPSLAAIQRSLGLLRRERFVLDAPGRGTVVAYHDRLREAIASAMEPARAVMHHRDLARAWEKSPSPSGVRVARHHLAAGDQGKAAPWLDRAIQEAFSSSAFGLAEELCSIRLALDGAPLTPEQRWKLELVRSDALAYDGAFSESADALVQLVDQAQGEVKRDALIRAAQRLLQAGEVGRGLEAARAALRAVGVPWSESDLRLCARLAWQQLALDHTRLPVAEGVLGRRVAVSAELDLQLDTLWRLLQPIWYADLLRSAECSVCYLRLAVRAQDPRHLALALAAYSVIECMRDPASPRTAKLARQGSAWGELDGSAVVRAYLVHAQAGRAYAGSRWRDAEAGFEEAAKRWRTECPTERWLQTGARAMYFVALFFRGKLGQLALQSEAWVREAQARRDMFSFSQAVVAGYGALRHLLRDEPALARMEVDEAMRPWRNGRYGFLHLCEARVRDLIATYEQTGIASRMPLWTTSSLPFGVVGNCRRDREIDALLREELMQSRGRFAPSARLTRELAEQRRCGQPRMRAQALLYLAQIELMSDNRREARTTALEAAQALAACGEDLNAAAARLVGAAATGGSELREHEQGMRDVLAAQGWKDVERALAWLLPAWSAHVAAR